MDCHARSFIDANSHFKLQFLIKSWWILFLKYSGHILCLYTITIQLFQITIIILQITQQKTEPVSTNDQLNSETNHLINNSINDAWRSAKLKRQLTMLLTMGQKT